MGNTDQTKSLIVSKAVNLFNMKGYGATSLSDITKATGMTKGAIYGNFESKQAVAIAAFEYAASKVITEISREIAAAPTAPLKLKAILRYYSRYLFNPTIDGGCPIINTAVEADDLYPELQQKAADTILMIKQSLKKIMNRGIVEGQLRANIETEPFVHMYYAAIKGAIVISRVEKDSKTFDLIRQNLESQIDLMSTGSTSAAD